ncbi:hypothetical protein G3I48_32770 [Streptomyces griseus]|nr:hypothetical protein [Streptomyces sp. SID724]NEB57013.1 hypothetical protein [Streptomyces griseus]
MLTINVGVLLAVIVLLRLRRRTEARSRNDEKLTVIIVLALGVVIAPTPLGGGHRRLPGPARLRRHQLLPLKPERARWPTAAHHLAAGPQHATPHAAPPR